MLLMHALMTNRFISYFLHLSRGLFRRTVQTGSSPGKSCGMLRLKARKSASGANSRTTAEVFALHRSSFPIVFKLLHIRPQRQHTDGCQTASF